MQKKLKNSIRIKIQNLQPKINSQMLPKHIKHCRMNKKEKFMINMECLQMNKKITKIWVSMEIREGLKIFQVLKTLPIFGGEEVHRIRVKDSRIFLETLKIFSVMDKREQKIDLSEEKILFFIQKYHFKNLLKEFKRQLITRLETLAKLVKVRSANLERSPQNVPVVKEREVLILDKAQCKYKCSVVLATELEQLTRTPAILVEDKEYLTKQDQRILTFLLGLIQVKT